MTKMKNVYLQMLEESLIEFDKAEVNKGPAADIIAYDGDGEIEIGKSATDVVSVLERFYFQEEAMDADSSNVASGMGPGKDKDVENSEADEQKLADIATVEGENGSQSTVAQTGGAGSLPPANAPQDSFTQGGAMDAQDHPATYGNTPKDVVEGDDTKSIIDTLFEDVDAEDDDILFEDFDFDIMDESVEIKDLGDVAATGGAGAIASPTDPDAKSDPIIDQEDEKPEYNDPQDGTGDLREGADDPSGDQVDPADTTVGDDSTDFLESDLYEMEDDKVEGIEPTKDTVAQLAIAPKAPAVPPVPIIPAAPVADIDLNSNQAPIVDPASEVGDPAPPLDIPAAPQVDVASTTDAPVIPPTVQVPDEEEEVAEMGDMDTGPTAVADPDLDIAAEIKGDDEVVEMGDAEVSSLEDGGAVKDDDENDDVAEIETPAGVAAPTEGTYEQVIIARSEIEESVVDKLIREMESLTEDVDDEKIDFGGDDTDLFDE